MGEVGAFGDQTGSVDIAGGDDTTGGEGVQGGVGGGDSVLCLGDASVGVLEVDNGQFAFGLHTDQGGIVRGSLLGQGVDAVGEPVEFDASGLGG